MLNIFSTIKFVRTMATNKGLDVVFHDEGPMEAWTDSRCVYLPRLSATATEEDYKTWLFLVYHELGHNTAPADDCFSEAAKRKVNMKSSFGRFWNLVEDFRQEYLLSGKYHGRDRAVSEGRAITSVASLNECLKDTPADAVWPVWLGMFSVTDRVRCRFQPDMYKTAALHDKIRTAESGAFEEKLTSLGMDEELCTLKTAAETYEYVTRLLEAAGMDPEKAKEDGPGGSGGEGAGEDGKLSDELLELMDKMLAHDHAGEPAAEEEQDGKAGKSKHRGKPTGRRGPKSKSTAGYIVTEPNVVKWNQYSGTEWDVACISSNVLASHLRKVLQVRSQAGYEYGHKSGKLASKHLARVVSGQDTVYRRRDIRDTLDTAVSLLVDISGSMGRRDKYPVAAAAAALMSRTLDLCGVQNEIINFCDNNPGSDRVLIKGWEERPAQDELCKRLGKCGPGSQNLDGEAIQFAFERLQERPQKRKILLVLSDGCPSGSPVQGNESVYTAYVVKEIEKSDTEIYGIGFMDDSVKQYYSEYTVVRGSSEITDALMGIISKKLL